MQSGGKNDLPQIHIKEDIYDKYSEIYNEAMHNTKNHIHQEINLKVTKSIALKRGFKSKNNIQSKKFKKDERYKKGSS